MRHRRKGPGTIRELEAELEALQERLLSGVLEADPEQLEALRDEFDRLETARVRLGDGVEDPWEAERLRIQLQQLRNLLASFEEQVAERLDSLRRRRELQGRYDLDILRQIQTRGSLRPRDLGEALSVDSGNLSRTLSRLVHLGYLSRIEVGRASHYALTPRAEAVLQRLDREPWSEGAAEELASLRASRRGTERFEKALQDGLESLDSLSAGELEAMVGSLLKTWSGDESGVSDAPSQDFAGQVDTLLARLMKRQRQMRELAYRLQRSREPAPRSRRPKSPRFSVSED